MNQIEKQKDQMQKTALNLWYRNNCRGTMELCTGAGKTRIGILAASYFAKQFNYSFNILIIVPTTVLREEWEKEFKKWGELKVFNSCVKIECINTAREYKKNHYDLMILDEIHNYLLGEENSKVYKKNTYDRILGLSATIENSLLPELNRIAPICYSMDLNTAVELKLVSNYTVLNIGVTLTPEEMKTYTNLTYKIDYAFQAYGQRSWKNISLRKELLYHAQNKLTMITNLVNLFQDEYGIIFSMTKDYADLVGATFKSTCILHHSGLSKKQRIENLKKFADGRTKIRLISSAKTVDEGVTLPRVKFAIIGASSSKPRQVIQRVGRVIRLADDKDKAYIIRVYVKNSKEEHWVSNSQNKLKCIDFASLSELKKYLKLKK